MKIIAIPSYNSNDAKLVALNKAYTDYIENSGYTPMVVTITDNKQVIKTIANKCDGLLLPGGADIDPIYYLEDNISSQGCSIERDSFERNLFREFISNSKPIMGICRGFQLIMREFINSDILASNSNIEYYQHINNHSLANARGVSRSTPTHFVHILSNMYKPSGKSKTPNFKLKPVNSMHHQGIIYTGTSNLLSDEVAIAAKTDINLTTNATATLIEGIIAKINDSVILGVQWHPEELKDYGLITTIFKKHEIHKYA